MRRYAHNASTASVFRSHHQRLTGEKAVDRVESVASGATSIGPVRVNLWTQPRSASTALMYSFKSRGDCAVVDEPLYAAHVTATGESRPYLKELLASQSSTTEEVIEGGK